MAGITAETKYNVYVVYTAGSGSNTTDSDVTLVNGATTTASDKTAPDVTSATASFDEGTPGDTTQDLTITLKDLDEGDTAHWIIVAGDTDSAVAPDVAGVKAGTGAVHASASGSMPVTAGPSVDVTKDGITLDSETAYDIYVVLTDSAGNDRLLPVIDDVLTEDEIDDTANSAPNADATAAFAGGTASDDGLQDLTITLANLDKAGTAHWVIVASTTAPADAPDVVGVKAGTGAVHASASGSMPVTAGLSVDVTKTGITLDSETAYDIYVVLTSGSDNRLLSVIDDVRTADDISPDVTGATAAYSNDDDETDGEQKLTISLVGLTEAATAFWVIVAEGVGQTRSEVTTAGGDTRDIDYANGSKAAGMETVSATGDQTIEIDNIVIADNTITDVFVVLSDGTNTRLLTKIDATAAEVTAPIATGISADWSDDDDNTPGEQNLTITLTGVSEVGRAYWLLRSGPSSSTNAQVVRATGSGARDIDYTDGNMASGMETIDATGDQTIVIDDIKIADNLNTRVYVALEDTANKLTLVVPLRSTAAINPGLTANTTAPSAAGARGDYSDDDDDTPGKQRFTLSLTDLVETGRDVTVFWVIVAEGATPTEGQVVAAGDGGMDLDYDSDSMAAGKMTTTQRGDVMFEIDDLVIADGTVTDVYVVLSDGTLRIFLPKIDATAAAGTPAPIIGGAPMVTVINNPTETVITIIFGTLSEDIDEYWWVLTGAGPTPDVNAVMSGTDGRNPARDAGSSTTDITVAAKTVEIRAQQSGSALPSTNDLVVQIVGADADGNLSEVFKSPPFSTLDTTAPTVTSLSASEMESAGGGSSDITLTFTGLSEYVARYWWVLLPNAAGEPSEGEIKAGQASGGGAALASGVSLTASGAIRIQDEGSGASIPNPTVDLTGIQVGGTTIPDDDYEVFVFIEDIGGTGATLTTGLTVN